MREVNGRLVVMKEAERKYKRGFSSKFDDEWDRTTAILKLCGKDLSKIVITAKKEE